MDPWDRYTGMLEQILDGISLEYKIQQKKLLKACEDVSIVILFKFDISLILI